MSATMKKIVSVLCLVIVGLFVVLLITNANHKDATATAKADADKVLQDTIAQKDKELKAAVETAKTEGKQEAEAAAAEALTAAVEAAKAEGKQEAETAAAEALTAAVEAAKAEGKQEAEAAAAEALTAAVEAAKAEAKQEAEAIAAEALRLEQEKTAEVQKELDELKKTLTPAEEPAKSEEPAAEPAKAEEPAAEPAKAEEPAAEPAKAEEPAAEPAKTDEPVAEPAKAEEPAAEPAKAEEPAAEPAKAEEPAAEPAKAEEPAAEPAKAEEPAVMSYAEYEAAEKNSEVTVETYVQDKQSWWQDKANIYCQSEDGAYFLYELPISQEDYDKLVPGTKIRVKGYKSEWSGEVEIVDAAVEVIEGEPFIAEAEDVTALLGTDDLIKNMNKLVAFKGMTVEAYDETGAAFAYKDASGKTDDLYFKVSKDGQVYDFCVEFYLCGQDTEVYKAVEALNVGDVIDMEGFLYWYNGANPHITKVTPAQ